MSSQIKQKIMVYPTLLSFGIGRALGGEPTAVLQIILKDGRVFTQFVRLTDR